MSIASSSPDDDRKSKFASDCFKKATEAMAKQNWDYAVEMFSVAIKMRTGCLLGDMLNAFLISSRLMGGVGPW